MGKGTARPGKDILRVRPKDQRERSRWADPRPGSSAPSVSDSLFTVARMLQASGQDVLAARLLNEVISLSGDTPRMRSHLARALWFLANVETKIKAVQKQGSAAISDGAGELDPRMDKTQKNYSVWDKVRIKVK
ncbi:hypothetical protein QBC37DRAFT_455203 [Rhypophila decipiens]|uniref:Uncharacterized protein n=1 Tax=Rhypophila decipiens TaxID=261697 RepID=A0AAN6YI05_9PEZI|nr:hypothetical protein QBC37DRAFT_455203 [Rhypophila decipiens]